MKVNTKIHKTYNNLIRAVIVVAIYFFLYRQVFYKRNLEEVYNVIQDFIEAPNYIRSVVLLLILMLINWGLEAMKWRVLITKIEDVGFFKAFQAVLAGVSVSIFMPNRSGEFLGRVFILEKANRIEGVLITFIGSISQIVITISLGLFGFLAFFYQYLDNQTSMHGYLGVALILLVPIMVFILLLIYFNIGAITPLLTRFLKGKKEKYIQYAEVFAKYPATTLLKVLMLSLARYLVFSSQFYILLVLFNADVAIPEALILITVIYLLMMIMPSIALTEIGIRGSLSVYMFSLYYQRMGVAAEPYHLGIFAASSLLWMINIVIPAIAGTFFVFNLKFFRK